MNRVWPNRAPLLYTLDAAGQPVAADDLSQWAQWLETADRTIGLTRVGPLEVSTVFLGVRTVDNFLASDRPVLFETMLFGDEAAIAELAALNPADRSIIARVLGSADFQRRYATRAEAEAGHAEVVALVRERVAARN
jgi:hypothetical protein